MKRRTKDIKETELVLACVRLHRELHAAGLYATGHKMNEVVQRIGWEIAERITEKESLARGKGK